MINIEYELLQSDIPSSLRDVIIQSVEDVVNIVKNKDLPDHQIKIEIESNPDQTIQETGSGGWTEDPGKLHVYYDQNSEVFLGNVGNAIASATAHELGHAFRELTHPFPGTLLDDLVAEGLADNFDIEVTSSKLKPWSSILKEGGLLELYKRAVPFFKMKDYGYKSWFFGSEDLDLPKWGGYALGNYLVELTMKRTGKSASQLISEPSSSFLVG